MSFDNDYAFSQSHESEDLDILRQVFPSASFTKATQEEDWNGTDWWVHEDFYPVPISVDFKRQRPRISKYQDLDIPDVCLELSSDVATSRLGWSNDVEKQHPDAYIWAFPDNSYAVVYAPHFRQAVMRHQAGWEHKYGCKTIDSGFGKTSLICWVPLSDVLDCTAKEHPDIKQPILVNAHWKAR